MLAIASKPRGERLSVGATKLPAALLTRPVRPPDCQSASTIASTASAARMSTPKVSMRRSGNCWRQASAVASQTALRRPQMATSAPRRRNCSAIAWPRPVPPPVTRIRWPAISCGSNMVALLGLEVKERGWRQGDCAGRPIAGRRSRGGARPELAEGIALALVALLDLADLLLVAAQHLGQARELGVARVELGLEPRRHRLVLVDRAFLVEGLAFCRQLVVALVADANPVHHRFERRELRPTMRGLVGVALQELLFLAERLLRSLASRAQGGFFGDGGDAARASAARQAPRRGPKRSADAVRNSCPILVSEASRRGAGRPVARRRARGASAQSLP